MTGVQVRDHGWRDRPVAGADNSLSSRRRLICREVIAVVVDIVASQVVPGNVVGVSTIQRGRAPDAYVC